MTLRKPAVKSNDKVSFIPDQSYALWRRSGHVALMLQEGPQRPTEHLLQLVWLHQRVQRDRLQLVDGTPVQILHPGFLNHEAGPDFREAIIRVGGDAPRRGDIEIDLDTRGWRGHGHDTNRDFTGVILHVVWESFTPTALPTLELQHLLDSPPHILAEWINTEPGDRLPVEFQGRCASPLRELSEESLSRLLLEAAMVRLEGKGRRLRARARETGWDQALWEGLWRGLGYKHNVWPMQRLAELRREFPDGTSHPLRWQALLLGTAGFLPEDIRRASPHSRDYVRRLWDHWWRDRDALQERMLPREAWRRGGMRPANHPERRLALAAHWLSREAWVKDIEAWGLEDAAPARALASLTRLLQADHDPFWSRHWTLHSRRMARGQPLIGATRVTDLAMNAVLPWLWIRAKEGNNETLRTRLETLYAQWPAAQDNASLRLARERLLGSTWRPLPAGAAHQQGLLQIIRDFCGTSNSLCEHCRFPDLALRWLPAQP